MTFDVRVVKERVAVGNQGQTQIRYFVFVLPLPKKDAEPVDSATLRIADAHYQIWDDGQHWRWAMTKTKYPYDEVGVRSHGGQRTLNACVRACVQHFKTDVVALGRHT